MIGQTISHYKILEKLGEGGMGVVYKAQDTTLDRFVALKFLPPHLNASEQDKARFIQEAKAAGSLNHPNICTIHGIEEHNGKTFIVMEHVEGQTLRDKGLNVPPKQAIDFGIQLADGLAAAHEKGIVHRDIKPENIMIRKDGRAQIMDFGLAKLKGASRLTKEGTTVGTAGYMSPEQVQGLETDHRTDIFSLGVVLYELIAGQSPFKGVHETAISYEIVNVEPEPISAIKPEIDPQLDAIVFDCLEKDPKERYQSVAEVARNLKRFKKESSRTRANRVTGARPAYQGEARSATPLPIKFFGRERLPWIIGGVFALISMGLGIVHFLEGPPERESIRFLVPTPEKSAFDIATFSSFAISPNGRLLAFVVTDSLRKSSLWLRPLNSLTAQPLPGTEDAYLPFWSPDNRSIGFFAGSKLKRVEVSGEPALALCDAPNARGGTWNNEGTIVFSPVWNSPLFRVSAAGGIPTPVTKIDTIRHEQTHRFPHFLPDGNHFLYFSWISADKDAVYIGSLDGKTDKLLIRTTGHAEYAAGSVLYLRDQTLMAQPFDERGLSFKSDAFPVAQEVLSSQVGGSAMFTASRNGVLVYLRGIGSIVMPIWFDRTGKQIGTLGEPGAYNGVRISPDGRQVAMSIIDLKSKNTDIWIFELARGIRTRFTFDPKNDGGAAWSGDGSSIVFASVRKGNNDIYRRRSDGATPEEPIIQTDVDEQPEDWSRDGKYILYRTFRNPKTGYDLWVLPLTGDRKPFPFLQTEFFESNARFSPDVRWVAYTSDESGSDEVYARPFPGPGPKWQVSTGGGGHPRWRRDGKEIYYRSGDGKIMAAQLNMDEAKFEVQKVEPFFQARFATTYIDSYDVTADGQRFLIISTPENRTSSPLTVVVNWDAEVRKK